MLERNYVWFDLLWRRWCKKSLNVVSLNLLVDWLFLMASTYFRTKLSVDDKWLRLDLLTNIFPLPLQKRRMKSWKWSPSREWRRPNITGKVIDAGKLFLFGAIRTANYSWCNCLIAIADNLLLRHFQLFNFDKVRNSSKQATILTTFFPVSLTLQFMMLLDIQQGSFSASSGCVCWLVCKGILVGICLSCFAYNFCFGIDYFFFYIMSTVGNLTYRFQTCDGLLRILGTY